MGRAHPVAAIVKQLARQERIRAPARPYVVEEQAAFVRDLFRRYLEIGSVVRLKAVLDQENVRLPIRADGSGKTTAGGLISRGHL